jgi:hypothetical protein
MVGCVRLSTVTRKNYVRRLYVASDIELPPYSQYDVPARSVWTALPVSAVNWLVEPKVYQPCVLSALTLLVGDTAYSCIRVLNYSHRLCTLRAGKLLGNVK